VASRRLRELLPLMQLDGATAHKLGRRLRKLTGRLGAVREQDVLLQMVDGLRQSGRYSDRALALVADRIAHDHARVRDHLVSRAPSTEIARIARKLERLAEILDRSDSSAGGRAWRWAVDARLAKRAQTLRDAVEYAGALYLPDRLHAVRIALKKFRYAAELDAEMSGARATADLQVLKRVQTLLGRLHDLDVLIVRLRQLQGSHATDVAGLRREVDVLVASLENACRRLHARYVHERSAVDAICLHRLPSVSHVPRRAGARRAAM
jgi:CHAD domain-containing protein